MLIYEGTARAAGKPALQDSSIKFYCQGDDMLMNALLTRWALALFTVKGHYAVFGANIQTAVKQQVKLCSNKPEDELFPQACFHFINQNIGDQSGGPTT